MRRTQSGTWTGQGLGVSVFELRCRQGGVVTVAHRQGAEVAAVEVDATEAGQDLHVDEGRTVGALSGVEQVPEEGPARTLLHEEVAVAVVEGLAREASECVDVKV